MRICILTEYFNPGGAGGTPSMIPALARELKLRYPQLDIDVLTSRNMYRGTDVRLPARDDWEGLRVFRLSSPRSNQNSTLQRLFYGWIFAMMAWLRLLALPRFDVLFVGTNPPTAPIAAGLLQRLRKTPYVYLIHDLFPDVGVALRVLSPTSKLTRLAYRLQRRWLREAARVVAIGRCMQGHLVKTYDLPLARTVVIPNWSDPDKITPLPKATRFRAQQDLPGFVVLYSGNFGQHQDFDGILETAKRLQTTRPEVTFVLVGEGAKKAALQERIAAESLRNVRLFPFVPLEDFPDLLASADVALVTLEPGAEGVGVPSKFYNILAAGRPTLALVAPSSEIALVLDEAACGLRCDHDDVQGMTDAITRLAEQPREAERMGANARAVFLRSFTIGTVAAAYYTLFSEVAAPTAKQSALP